MRLRPYHLIVTVGLVAGIVAATFIQTEPRILGWLFAIGGGLAGGAFIAAITSGDALASGPAPRGRRGAASRPAWFDEPDDPDADGRPPSDH